MNTLRAWFLAIVSLCLAAYALLMWYQTRPSAFAMHNEVLYPQIVQMETAREASQVSDLLRSNDPGNHDDQVRQYRASIRWDDKFLLLYPLQLISVCVFAWGLSSKRYAVAAICLILAGGCCDWEENRHVIEILNQSTANQGTVDALRNWSVAKWLLDGAAWLCAAIALHLCSHAPAGQGSEAAGKISPSRVRAITVGFWIAGFLSLSGAVSFLPHWDFRAFLEASVLWNGGAVIACVFRPRSRFNPTKASPSPCSSEMPQHAET